MRLCLTGGLLAEALEVAQRVKGDELRAFALRRLIQAGEPSSADVLARFLAVAREIDRAEARAMVVSGLAPHLAALPRAVLYPLWRETLHTLTGRPRRHLLGDLRAFRPVLLALGGQRAAREMVRAIIDRG